MAANSEISTGELLNFLKGFKESVEKKIEVSEKKLECNTVRIEARLGSMDTNIVNMKEEMRTMAAKTDKDIGGLTNRLAKLEEDVRRMKFAKMKSPVRNAQNGMTILPVPRNQEPIRKQPRDREGRNISPIQPEGRRHKPAQPFGRQENE